MTLRIQLVGLLSAGLLTMAASAQTSVTIYGVFDAGFELSNSGKGTIRRVVSGGALGSRLGFRGIEDLGDGLSAVFRLEQGFAGDEGILAQGGRAFGREASVGLSKAGIGTLTVGRLPTPVSLVNANVDAFFWMGSGGLISLTKSGAATRQVIPQVVNARVDNAINYVSPVVSNVEMRAMLALGEGSAVVGRAYGLSARYAKAPAEAVVGYGRQEGAGDAGGRMQALTIGGSYDLKVARIHVGYTVEKNSCSTCTGALARVAGVTDNNASEFRLINFGTRIPFGLFTAIAQVVRVHDRSTYAIDPGSRNATWVALGGDYLLSRRTAFYGALGTIGNRNGSQYALGSGGVQQPAGFVSAGDPRSTTATLGIRHLF